MQTVAEERCIHAIVRAGGGIGLGHEPNTQFHETSRILESHPLVPARRSWRKFANGGLQQGSVPKGGDYRQRSFKRDQPMPNCGRAQMLFMHIGNKLAKHIGGPTRSRHLVWVQAALPSQPRQCVAVTLGDPSYCLRAPTDRNVNGTKKLIVAERTFPSLAIMQGPL